MSRPRISIGGLIAAVATVAVDFAVIRTFYAAQYHFQSAFVYTSGILPMASLLILVALLSAPNLLRGGRLAPFLFGFEVVGWAVVFAFISWYAVATEAFVNFFDSIERFVVTEPRALRVLSASPFVLDNSAPDWAQISVALGFAIVVFSLPQLLLALLGGWLARKRDLTVRFERRATSDVRAKPDARAAMKARFRISIAAMMAAVAAVAVNVAVMRLVYATGSFSQFRFIYACGVLPMASLLITVGVLSAPSLLRGGWLSPFVVGFEVVGWAVVFVLISWYCVDANGIVDCIQAFASFVSGESEASWMVAEVPFDLEPPDRAEAALAFGFSVGLYSLPQLFLALLGGGLARKLKLTIRFEREGNQPSEASLKGMAS